MNFTGLNVSRNSQLIRSMNCTKKSVRESHSPLHKIQLVCEHQRKILTKSVVKTPGRPTAYHQSEETNAVYCATRRHTHHVIPDCERWLSYRPSSAHCRLAKDANLHRVYYSNVAHLGYCQDILSSALMTYADV